MESKIIDNIVQFKLNYRSEDYPCQGNGLQMSIILCTFASEKDYLKYKSMALRYTLRRNNIKSNKAYGMWYAHTLKQGELSMQEIEQRIQSHCTVTRADVRAVITALQEVVEEGLKSGYVVNLAELGKFYLSIRSECVDRPEDFSVQKHVKDIVCKYTPEGHRINASDPRIVRRFTNNVQLEQVSLYDESGHVAKRIRRGGHVSK